MTTGLRGWLIKLLEEAPKDTPRPEIVVSDGDDEEDEKTKNSNAPWVKIVGEVTDPTKGIGLELDWNDSFIKFLRTAGYTGASDETVVGKWLVDLYRQISSDIEGNKMNQYE